jgi:hypothetical protein
MAEWAAANGHRFVLYVRQGAKVIEGLRNRGIDVREF